MGRVLAKTVHLDGEVYAAGTEVPADVAKKISNPKVWADGDADPATTPEPSTADGGDDDADTGKARGRKRA